MVRVCSMSLHWNIGRNWSNGDDCRVSPSVLVLFLQLTEAKDKLRAVAKHLEVPEMQVCVCMRACVTEPLCIFCVRMYHCHL